VRAKSFLKVFTATDGAENTLTHLSVQRWREVFERRAFKSKESVQLSPQPGDPLRREPGAMLFLRLDQASELLSACRDLRERLIIRYFWLNGLSPMELSNGRIEHLDPLSCTLFLPRRHWKRNCLTDIDSETVRLQVIYSGDRTEGPLIRVRGGGRPAPMTLWDIVKNIALRTSIPGREAISPLVLKRTFAREWLLSGGSVGTLQKQFSHKHLWSTAHYLRFVMEDVQPNHRRMVRQLEKGVPG